MTGFVGIGILVAAGAFVAVRAIVAFGALVAVGIFDIVSDDVALDADEEVISDFIAPEVESDDIVPDDGDTDSDIITAEDAEPDDAGSSDNTCDDDSSDVLLDACRLHPEIDRISESDNRIVKIDKLVFVFIKSPYIFI
ncbi:MAG: hypothetical protein ACYCYI_12170 [Saccharofermentanales bacterium]